MLFSFSIYSIKLSLWQTKIIFQTGLPGRLANEPILTRREKEVLELIAEGLTNNEIAQRIFESTNTVDTHRKNLLTKLEAKNTASLVRIAAQLQLI